ncbi:TPA: Gfo/Idh/MocA family oxidoreductase [Candidatus Poribacteria bacterium]|nr:Gfo/Idh/MocA family oxidoreductase [Candidatus Poribacteria bacterium]
MAEKEYGVGIVGYGFIGKMHTYAYKSIPIYYNPVPANVRLVGVCTSKKETAEQAVKHGGFEFGTTDYHDLLKRDDIHIINCCTPNHLHKDILISAIKAGKHIYCDKPLTINIEDARQIIDEVKKSNIVNQMTFQYRFIPAIMRAKQLIDEGILGEPMSFRAMYLHAGYIDPDRPMSWRLDINQGGAGALFDLGSHVLDLIRYLLGECESVFATTETYIKQRPVTKGSKERVNVKVDDLSILILKMKNGAIGTVEASRIATGANDDLKIEIHGRDGAIKFNMMEANWLDVYDNRAEGEPIGGRKGFTRIETIHRYPSPAVFPGPKFSVGWERFHIASMFSFLTNVANQRSEPPTFYDGFKVQEIMEYALISAKQGTWVNIQ